MLHETTAYFETIDSAELAVRRLRETNAKISKIMLQADYIEVPQDYDWEAVQHVSYPIYVSALGFGSSPFTTNLCSKACRNSTTGRITSAKPLSCTCSRIPKMTAPLTTA